jgi:hypothetical protein
MAEMQHFFYKGKPQQEQEEVTGISLQEKAEYESTPFLYHFPTEHNAFFEKTSCLK